MVGVTVEPSIGLFFPYDKLLNVVAAIAVENADRQTSNSLTLTVP